MTAHPNKDSFFTARDKKNGDSVGQSNPLSLWSFFDQVYCISLRNRADRRLEAGKQFARVGLADRVEYVLVDKEHDDPQKGIYESHLLCMQKGIAAAARRILIFEDDVVFAANTLKFQKKLAKILKFLREDKSWDILFLGCMVSKSRKLRGFPICQVQYRSLTHGYVITEDFARVIVQEHPWHNKAYDDFLRDLHSERMFTAYPSIAFQSNSPSDNDAYLWLDRMRRCFGGLTGLQKFDEWYHRYSWWLSGGHIFLLGLLMFLWASP